MNQFSILFAFLHFSLPYSDTFANFPSSRARLSLFSTRCCVIFAVLIPPLSSLDHNYGSIERATKLGAAWRVKEWEDLEVSHFRLYPLTPFFVALSPPTIQVIRPRTAHSNHAVMRLCTAVTFANSLNSLVLESIWSHI